MKEYDGYEMLIRVFVEASEEQSCELAEHLKSLFQDNVYREDIENYAYKEPGWHIISFFVPLCEIHNIDVFNQALDEISQKLAVSGWQYSYAEPEIGGGSAIWNATPEAHFVIEKARFAHLDVCPPKRLNDEMLKDFVPEELD